MKIFNNYFILKQLFLCPRNLLPHISVSSIDQIDFLGLKKLGVKYLVFDRDNTLTIHLETSFADVIHQKTVEKCKSIFGGENVAILSNSEIGLEGKTQLGMQIIYTEKRKPQNFNFIKQHFRSINPAEICIIGDRAMTDVLLATLNQAVAVLTQPIKPDSDCVSIKFSRFIELSLMSQFRNNTQQHPIYGDISQLKLLK